ncbi:hypothetical protein K2173_028219 [Erythroxylum novogranatense]|uniref:TRASH domain-containing protein n=1 Tax=Erythroxylum novogranatense TaxID=1862640 RepID=A0AAV8U186_9ROSI|nr:hypothetical protein K2173_028219 [Erythroxylum novogranatense]
MRLEKCWFCSLTVYPGHDIQFVRNDAKIFRFYRSKGHKNFKMKRNPCKDSTFELNRKRNRPERYDITLAENTSKAIKNIDKIRSDRLDKHIGNIIHLIKAPAALLKDPSLTVPKIQVKVH